MAPERPTDRGRGDDGTTLAEITLALALISVVALAVAGLVTASARTDTGRTETAVTRLETTIALDRLSSEVRAADRVNSPAAGSASSVLHLESTEPAGAWTEWSVTAAGLERRTYDGSITSEWVLEAAGLSTEAAGGPFVAYAARDGSALDPLLDGQIVWSTCSTSVTATVRMPEYNGDDVLTRSVTIRRRALLEQTC